MMRWGRPGVAGVTLIEMLVVVVLAGVLLGFAVPSYRGYVLRANRLEARAALLALATAQEKFYLQCHGYSSNLGTTTACAPAGLEFPATSERGYYAIAVTAANSSGWAATARAVPGGPQFADTRCREFQLTSQGLKTASDAADAESGRECWSR